jgi:hypothetical protein
MPKKDPHPDQGSAPSVPASLLMGDDQDDTVAVVVAMATVQVLD